MQLQRVVNQSFKAEFIVEIIGSVSGLLLALFLWTHMVFVATILLGVSAFNVLASFLENYYLLPAAIIFIIAAFGAHVAAVMRRIPARFRDQKIVWKHAKLIRHTDTWTWVFQVVSGSAILILATIHVVAVAYGGIDAKLSADRISSAFLWFYLLLLVLGEYHASIGLYRFAVKWGWVKRQSAKRVLSIVTICILLLGLVTIGAFFKLGGSL